MESKRIFWTYEHNFQFPQTVRAPCVQRRKQFLSSGSSTSAVGIAGPGQSSPITSLSCPAASAVSSHYLVLCPAQQPQLGWFLWQEQCSWQSYDLYPVEPVDNESSWVLLLTEFPLPSQAFFPGLSFYLIMDRTYIYWTIASTLVSSFPRRYHYYTFKITLKTCSFPLFTKNLFVHSGNAPCNCLHTIAFTPTHLRGSISNIPCAPYKAIVGLQSFRHFLVAYTGFVEIPFRNSLGTKL